MSAKPRPETLPGPEGHVFAQTLRIGHPGAQHLPASRQRRSTRTASLQLVSALLDQVDMTTNAARLVRQYPVVRQYMTPTPHTIGRSQSISAALATMHEHHLRHLPVLEGGRIVGVVSERDILLIESLWGVNPAEVRVEEAMVQDVFVVGPDMAIGEVIETMIERKVGSALVTENERVVGIFTTIDALQALQGLLERQ